MRTTNRTSLFLLVATSLAVGVFSSTRRVDAQSNQPNLNQIKDVYDKVLGPALGRFHQSLSTFDNMKAGLSSALGPFLNLLNSPLDINTTMNCDTQANRDKLACKAKALTTQMYNKLLNELPAKFSAAIPKILAQFKANRAGATKTNSTPGTKPLEDQAKDADVPSTTEQDNAQGGAFVGGPGMSVLTKMLTFPEAIKQHVKDLLWVRLDDPTSAASDDSIRAFFQARMNDLQSMFDNLPGAEWIPTDVKTDLKTLGVTIMTEFGTPPIRLLRFLRTKMKDIIMKLIMAAMQATVNVDTVAQNLMGELKVPEPIAKMLAEGAKMAGTALGAFTQFLANTNPKLAAVITKVADTMGNTADSLEGAMDAAVDLAVATGGTPKVPGATSDSRFAAGDATIQQIEGTAIEKTARVLCPIHAIGRNPAQTQPRCNTINSKPELDGQFKTAARQMCDEITQRKDEKPIFKEAAAACVPLKAFVSTNASIAKEKARRAAQFAVGKVKYFQALTMKREKVAAGLDVIFAGLRDAFVAFATPALEQLTQLINMGLNPALQAIRTMAAKVMRAIPEAGGYVGTVFKVIAGVAIPIILEIPPRIVTPLIIDIIAGEIENFKVDFLNEWDKPGGADFFDRFATGPMAKFFGVFKLAKGALDGFRKGLEGGLGAMLEGPIAAMLLKNLPPGTGPLVVSAISGVLTGMFNENTFQGGQFNFDLPEIVYQVLKQVQPKLKEFLLANWKNVAASTPNVDQAVKDLVPVLVTAFDAAYGAILLPLEAQPRDLSSLADMNVIRDVIARFVESASEQPKGIVDFLLSKLLNVAERANAKFKLSADCTSALSTGLKVIVKRGIVPLIRNSNEMGELFQQGIPGLFIRIVRMAVDDLTYQEGGQSRTVEGPLKQLITCGIPDGITGNRWKDRLKKAVEQARVEFERPDIITDIQNGGFLAAIRVIIKVSANPIAGIIADMVGVPQLEDPIASAILAASDFETVIDGFKVGGITGAIQVVLKNRKVQDAIIAWLKLLFVIEAGGDTENEIRTALNTAADGLTEQAFADKGIKGIWDTAGPPAARAAFKAVVDTLKSNLDEGKAALTNFAERAATLMGDPAIADYARPIVVGLRVGAGVSLDSARPCGNPDKLNAMSTEVLKRVFDCVKTALEVGAQAATEAGVNDAVRLLSEKANALLTDSGLVQSIKDRLQQGESFLSGATGVVGELAGKLSELAGMLPSNMAEAEKVSGALAAFGKMNQIVRDLGPQVANALRDSVAEVLAAGLKGAARPFAGDINPGCVIPKGTDSMETFLGKVATCVLRAAREASVVGAVHGLKEAANQVATNASFRPAFRALVRGLADLVREVGGPDARVPQIVVDGLTDVADLTADVGDDILKAGARTFSAALYEGETPVEKQKCARPRDKANSREVGEEGLIQVSFYWERVLRCVADAGGAAFAAARDQSPLAVVKALARAARRNATDANLADRVAQNLTEFRSMMEEAKTKIAAVVDAKTAAARTEGTVPPNPQVPANIGTALADALNVLKGEIDLVAADLQPQIARTIAAGMKGGLGYLADQLYIDDARPGCAKPRRTQQTAEGPAETFKQFSLRVLDCALIAARDSLPIAVVKAIAEAARQAGANQTMSKVLKRIVALAPQFVEKLGVPLPSAPDGVKAALTAVAGAIASLGDDVIKGQANAYAAKIDPKCAVPRKTPPLPEEAFTAYLERVLRCVVGDWPEAWKKLKEDVADLASKPEKLVQKGVEALASGSRGIAGRTTLANDIKSGFNLVRDLTGLIPGGLDSIPGIDQATKTKVTAVFGIVNRLLPPPGPNTTEVMAKVAAAGVKGGLGAFADAIHPKCAPERSAQQGFPDYLKAVAECLAIAARDSAALGGVRALAEASRQLADNVAFYDLYKTGMSKTAELLTTIGVSPPNAPPDIPADVKTFVVEKFNGIVTDMTRLGNASVKAGARSFGGELDAKCAKVREAAKEFKTYLKETALCVWTAAKGSILAGALGGAKEAILMFVESVEANASDAQTKANALINALQFLPADWRGKITKIVTEKKAAGTGAFRSAAIPKCQDLVTALNVDVAKTVVTCLVDAAGAGATAVGVPPAVVNAVKTAVTAAINAVDAKARDVAAKINALVALLPGLNDRFKAALRGIASDVVGVPTGLFREIAGPECDAALTAFGFETPTRIAECLFVSAKLAATEAVRISLRAAVDSFNGTASVAGTKLRAFLSAQAAIVPAEVKTALESLTTIPAAMFAAGKTRFVKLGRACVPLLAVGFGSGLTVLRQSLLSVGQCLVEAAQSAFKSAAGAGLRAMLRVVLESFGVSIDAGKQELAGFLSQFGARTPATNLLKTVFDGIPRGMYEDGKTAFLRRARHCPDWVSEGSLSSPSELGASIERISSCLARAARSSFDRALMKPVTP